MGQRCPTCGQRVKVSLATKAMELASSHDFITAMMLMNEQHCTRGTADNVLSDLTRAGKLSRIRKARYALRS